MCKAIVMSLCTWYFDTLTRIQQQWSRKGSNNALSYNTKVPQIEEKMISVISFSPLNLLETS